VTADFAACAILLTLAMNTAAKAATVAWLGGSLVGKRVGLARAMAVAAGSLDISALATQIVGRTYTALAFSLAIRSAAQSGNSDRSSGKDSRCT